MAENPRDPVLVLQPMTVVALGLCTALLILYVAAEFAFPVFLQKEHLADFDVFHLTAGMLARGERLAAAYDAVRFWEVQQTLGLPSDRVQLWNYPPTFALMVAPLAALPDWLAYALSMVATLALFLWVMRRLAGSEMHLAVVMAVPTIVIILRAGQNGLLTGALGGLVVLLALRRSAWAGVPLGLLALKPHLGLGLGAAAVFGARWGLLAVGFATALAFCGLSALIFGPDAWIAFLTAAERQSGIFAEATLPIYRMGTVFSGLLSVGVSPSVGLAVQGVVSVAGVVALAALQMRGAEARIVWGYALVLTPVLSPYAYDYDMGLMCMGAALLIAPMRARVRGWDGAILATGPSLTAVWGLMGTYVDEAGFGIPVAVCGPILAVMLAMTFVVLRRPQGAAAPSAQAI